MLHSDIVPEYSCCGQLVDLSETECVRAVRCSSGGNEFTYTQDCDWVTVVLPGMKSDL